MGDPIAMGPWGKLTVHQLHGRGLVGVGGLAGVCCGHALGERVVLVLVWVGKRDTGLQGHPADRDDGRHFDIGLVVVEAERDGLE